MMKPPSIFNGTPYYILSDFIKDGDSWKYVYYVWKHGNIYLNPRIMIGPVTHNEAEQWIENHV